MFSCGLPWIDAEVGGFPKQGVVAATGAAGAGKTTFGLSLALSALDRGQRVCFLTNELASAVLGVAERVYERDLTADVQNKTLSILTFAPFFVKKMTSLQSVDKPLEELGRFIAERRFEFVVFDTFDSMLGWAAGADIKPVVALVLERLRSWGVAVFCTLSDSVDASVEFCHGADGSVELASNRLVIRDAKWCNVLDLEMPFHIVQGRGMVAATSSQPPLETLPSLDDEQQPVPVSTILPPSTRGAAVSVSFGADHDARKDLRRERSPVPPSGSLGIHPRVTDIRHHAPRPSAVAASSSPVETVPPPADDPQRITIPRTLPPPSFLADGVADIFRRDEPRLAPDATPHSAPTVPPPAPTVPPPPDAFERAPESTKKAFRRRIEARVLDDARFTPSEGAGWNRRR